MLGRTRLLTPRHRRQQPPLPTAAGTPRTRLPRPSLRREKKNHGPAEAPLEDARCTVTTRRREWQKRPRDHVRPATTCRGRRRRAPGGAPRRPMAPLAPRSLIGEGAAVIRSAPRPSRGPPQQRCCAGRGDYASRPAAPPKVGGGSAMTSSPHPLTSRHSPEHGPALSVIFLRNHPEWVLFCWQITAKGPGSNPSAI